MATPVGTTGSLTLQNLSGLSLRRGDNDRERIWGGSARPTQIGTPVAEPQTAPIALGTLTDSADGVFGQDTEEALQRFQWYVAHRRTRLKLLTNAVPASGTIVDYAASPIGPPAMCNAITAGVIQSWLADNFVNQLAARAAQCRPTVKHRDRIWLSAARLSRSESGRGSCARRFCRHAQREDEPESKECRCGSAPQSDLSPRGCPASRRRRGVRQ